MTDLGTFEFQSDLESCPADCAWPSNGQVDIIDLISVLDSWSAPGGTPADVDHNGTVDMDDLLEVIHNWGLCP
jgi:hypothetical protein